MAEMHLACSTPKDKNKNDVLESTRESHEEQCEGKYEMGYYDI